MISLSSSTPAAVALSWVPYSDLQACRVFGRNCTLQIRLFGFLCEMTQVHISEPSALGKWNKNLRQKTKSPSSSLHQLLPRGVITDSLQILVIHRHTLYVFMPLVGQTDCQRPYVYAPYPVICYQTGDANWHKWAVRQGHSMVNFAGIILSLWVE